MKAVVFTLGCKVNEVESASIMAALAERDWEVSDVLTPADAYILNTCAVTAEAERKSRQLVARALKFNPAARVYVTGCASEKNSLQFERSSVRFIGGAKDKESVINAVINDFGGDGCARLPYPMQTRTRAFIKIEDGCDNFCSYCVIPYLRGRVRSRTVADIVAEVKASAAPEIVLTGINVSAFGRGKEDGDETLTGLLRALSFTDKRIRFGSLECNVIDDGFLEATRALKDFAPHFHLSLQSGSTAVLKAMNRHYTREEYIEKCKLIYKYYPDAAISTDIIAGFCGESDDDFKESLSIIDEVGFSRVHAFAFSPREGTRAYAMRDVAKEIKSERLHALLAAAKAAEERYIGERLGREYEVVFEEFEGEYTCGYTENYIRVFVEGRLCGKVKVVLTQPFKGGAKAVVKPE